MPQARSQRVDDDRLKVPHSARLTPLACEHPVRNSSSAVRFTALYGASDFRKMQPLPRRDVGAIYKEVRGALHQR
jgi:hypothetical protein